MDPIRVASFNVENLLRRFNFYRYDRLTAEWVLRLEGVELGAGAGYSGNVFLR